jgi:hypothetical protein
MAGCVFHVGTHARQLTPCLKGFAGTSGWSSLAELEIKQ